MEKAASSKIKQRSLVLILSLVITSAVAFLILVQNIITIRNTQKSISSDYIRQCENITRLYGEKIEQKLDELNSALGIYTNDESVQTKNTRLIIESLKRNRISRNRNFEYVAYVDAEGNFTSDEDATTNVMDREYFHAIMKEGKDFTVDIPVISKSSGKYVVHICRAAKVNGKTIGFFSGIVLVDSFNEILRDAKIGESGYSIMIARDGTYMASSMDSESAKKVIEINSSRDFRTELSDLKPGLAQSMWLENSIGKFLSTHYIVDGAPWVILMFVNRSEVFSLVQQNVMLILFSSIIMLAILALLIYVDCNFYLNPLKEVESSIDTISHGNADLTQRIKIKSKRETEIIRLVRGFNHFVEKLQTIMIVTKDSKTSLEDASNSLNLSIENAAASIVQISDNISNMDEVIQKQSQSVNSTAGAVNQITANINSMYKMIENQSAGINEASAAVEQMITNIRSVNNSMIKMDGEFSKLKQKSEEGVKKQKTVNENIKIIENDSKSLREANAVISSIAHQTNLLAMNAAIEAAHAGELGKGFSVVADEIRKLSETSSQQSKSIGEQLKNISENITNIVSTSQDAGTYLIDVAEGIHDTSGLVRQITNAMEEQEEGSRQIIVALQIMNNSTSEVKTASEEMTEGSNIILQAVEHLQNNTFTLKENMSEISRGADTINNISQELNNLSGKVNSSVINIGSQVDKFTV